MTNYCIEEDCKTQASFNYKGLKPKYCNTHKKNGMVYVRSKLCIKCNETVPYFNKIGLEPLYCATCKDDDMVDVKNKKCVKCDETQPIFNKHGLKPLYCAKCKDDNMVNVKSKMCIKCNETQPSFNKFGLKPLYCANCKDDDMVDVLTKMCVLCNNTRAWINKKYCSPCNATVNPDSVQGRKYRFKQNTIVDILKQYFNFDIIDKQINDGCTNRKPDLIIDCLTHVINIEIDEDQHKSKSYTPECEERRYDELFTAFADRPFVCIRFNPDKYIIKENNLVWNVDGIFSLSNKIDEKELDERVKILIQSIRREIDEIPEETFQIKYLFYDKK